MAAVIDSAIDSPALIHELISAGAMPLQATAAQLEDALEQARASLAAFAGGP